MTGQARLLVLSGLPGTGKSTLARALARHLRAAYLRVDTVEAALLNAGHAGLTVEGYAVEYALAADNLRLGLDVVVDCVNPVQATRDAWADAARAAGVFLLNVQVVCSDAAEHRRRVEGRHADTGEHTGRWSPPDWPTAQGYARDYEPWREAVLTVDTARATTPEHVQLILARLDRLTVDR